MEVWVDVRDSDQSISDVGMPSTHPVYLINCYEAELYNVKLINFVIDFSFA